MTKYQVIANKKEKIYQVVDTEWGYCKLETENKNTADTLANKLNADWEWLSQV